MSSKMYSRLLSRFKQQEAYPKKKGKKGAPADLTPAPIPKMAEMARQTTQGNLSSFAGVFNISDLTPGEKGSLKSLLEEYSEGKGNVEADLSALIDITSEVKAINNQAVILHGERIKKAHEILIRYRDGAFTTWLIAAYGNRQTPYNFMQYYNFYTLLPQPLRPKLEAMPRQVVYSLASREGSLPLKQQIIEGYNGETKTVLLEKIREAFPLENHDKRARNVGDSVITALARASSMLNRRQLRLTNSQKETLKGLMTEIQTKIDRLN